MSTPPPGISLVKWFPPISDSPTPEELSLRVRQIYNTLNQHDQAIETVHANATAAAATVTVPGTSTSTTKTVTITEITGFGNLAAVNDQTGQTAYTVQGTDNGSLIALNDASPIAITLNSVVTAPYFVFVANQGTGTATLSASSGLINGTSTVPGGSSVIAFYDGANWWIWYVNATSGVFPQNTPAVVHQWLNSYNSTTGAFGQTQPAFSDISGTITPATQFPASGVTAGSYTLTNLTVNAKGLVTAASNGTAGVTPVNTPAVSHQWLASYNSTTGAFTQTQPAFTDISGIAQIAQGGTGTATPALIAGTNTTITGAWPNQTINSSNSGGTVTSVALTVPSRQTVTGSPIISSGTLAISDNTQSANLVFAGPTTGSAAAPTFRALVGADLPNPSASTLGGVESIAAVAHQFLTSISTSGVPAQAQPAFTDISGTATIAQLPASVGTAIIGIVIDGGGSVPVTGSKGFVQVPYGATVTGWTMLADQSGSAQITVSKGAYSAFPTLTSIVASAPPALSSVQKNTSTTLTGWTTTITAGDVLGFNLDSVTTCQRIILELQVTKN